MGSASVWYPATFASNAAVGRSAATAAAAVGAPVVVANTASAALTK